MWEIEKSKAENYLSVPEEIESINSMNSEVTKNRKTKTEKWDRYKHQHIRERKQSCKKR